MSPGAAGPMGTGVPQDFAFTVFPNPCNAGTVLDFVLPRTARVRMELFDVSGRRIRTVASGDYGPGAHRMTLDTRALPAGIYFARLWAGEKTVIRKTLLLK